MPKAIVHFLRCLFFFNFKYMKQKENHKIGCIQFHLRNDNYFEVLFLSLSLIFLKLTFYIKIQFNN